jgi:hypothetical protein
MAALTGRRCVRPIFDTVGGVSGLLLRLSLMLTTPSFVPLAVLGKATPAARETVPTIEAMAEGMARADNKRAATAYKIDEQSAARAELAKAVEEYQPPPASQSFAAATQTASADAPAIAQQASTFAEAATAVTAAPVVAKQSAATAAAAIDAATIVEKSIDFSATARAPETATGEAASAGDNSPASSAGQALEALGGVAHGFSRIADSVAERVEGAIEFLAGLFGGGSSSAPTPQERAAPAPKAAPPAEPPPKKRRLSVEEYVAQEIEQRKAARQEIARRLGTGEAITKEELERIEMEQQKNSRDRGGGMSR